MGSPSSNRLDKLIDDTTKNAAIAMTAMIKILHNRWNICSFIRCLCCCRNMMVPAMSANALNRHDKLTIQADYDPHQESGQGQGQGEDEEHDDG